MYHMTPLNTQSARHFADCQKKRGLKKSRHAQREYQSVTQEGVETGDGRKDRGNMH